MIACPRLGRADQSPAGPPPGHLPGDGEFADIAITPPGEVAGRPDADDAGDLIPVSGDQDGPLSVRRGGERVFQPAAARRKRLPVIPPRRDPFGEPRREGEDSRPVSIRRGPDADVPGAHSATISPACPVIKAPACRYSTRGGAPLAAENCSTVTVIGRALPAVITSASAGWSARW
ncbi:MAG: hypothetical protein JO345_22355 [Streptosporangiaceae bacterium]|nr:hypothetical protein [Streptosporangiaceae bacterium]